MLGLLREVEVPIYKHPPRIRPIVRFRPVRWPDMPETPGKPWLCWLRPHPAEVSFRGEASAGFVLFTALTVILPAKLL